MSTNGTERVRRALLSVSDKTGVVELGRGLVALDIELVSTGGTAAALRKAELPVTDVSEITGFPEIMDGRVKTLHPKVHGGLLARRSSESHLKALKDHEIGPIDLVAVNLYPFEQVVAKSDTPFEMAIENIDIGGPSMLRSAAKNFEDVIVLCDPQDYSGVLSSLSAGSGSKDSVSSSTRRGLAQKVYSLTSRYDLAITNYLSSQSGDADADGAFPGILRPTFEKALDLRYGENPHQAAAFYRDPSAAPGSLAHATQLSGKELSYNNLLDLEAALAVVSDFDKPAAAVIKHTNPCGAAVATRLDEAFSFAMDGDRVSAFGGIVGLNREVDRATAEGLTAKNQFFEAIIAPGFSEEAVSLLQARSGWGGSVRLLCVGSAVGKETDAGETASIRLTSISGGLLAQTAIRGVPGLSDLKVVTERQPTDEELSTLRFCWVVCKHVKSNAIVLARENRVVGVGAGQMSRVDSTDLAGRKAGEKAKGSVLASDAFFPFPDGLEAAAAYGVTAVIQPGGSKKDPDVIAAADRLGVAMVLTGTRVFRH